ncbi:MAG: toll/interleukin-1 receptor domain-containing protein [Candidatus Thiodiazotropha sp. (ex. Lucinisca nassula)]|nr:toll/interleukin-1 receptor domain-containing protein [Candidatus Thiodiazotropha sp. (ex. Lucinisca nassula)]MBW9275288.1 toll/interleukin-1 receptor domain-containing protein [Candidatus Thiodiazotropha sp. (ex. Lucinisca nassula)]
MTDVFISYKREDRKRAHAIAEMFASHGYDVWWDIELFPGQKFADEINSVISNAKAVVVLWTPKSVLSDWVKAEAAIAFDRKILIPAWLEKVAIPAPYNTLHIIDLAGWNGTPDDPILEGLLAGVNNLIDKPVKLKKQLNEDEILAVLNKPAHEVEFWQAISNAKDQSISEYEAYLNKYGSKGVFSELAELRIVQLGKNHEGNNIPGFGKILTLSGIAIGIIVGIFQIIDMLGWLSSNGDDLPELAATTTNTETPIDITNSSNDIVVNSKASRIGGVVRMQQKVRNI